MRILDQCERADGRGIGDGGWVHATWAAEQGGSSTHHTARLQGTMGGMPVTADSDGSAAATAGTPWWAPAVFAATACGLGRVPFAPGTFGALLGLPLSLLTASAAGRLAGDSGLPAAGLEAALVAAMCVAGVPICSRAAALMGRKDPGAIVIDEVASMPLALLAVPAGERSPAALALAFALLRAFDIGKPFPCRALERLPTGLDIMADDWGAAAWTAVCLVAARWQHWI